MTASSPDYDDVAGRTRQSWLRSSLGSAAVILLVERGLLISSAPVWTRWLALVPAVVLMAVAVVRMRQIAAGDTARPPRPMVLLFMLGVAGLAVFAATSAAATGP